MKKFRITFKKLNEQGEFVVTLTTIVLCKSIRGAKIKARNLAPINTWHSQTIVDLTNEWNLKLDKIEFNY